MKFLSVPVFLISLFIGLFITYISSPAPRVIYVYPTPNNTHLFQYKDKAENCFSFDHIEVDCAAQGDKIKNVPIQN